MSVRPGPAAGFFLNSTGWNVIPARRTSSSSGPPPPAQTETSKRFLLRFRAKASKTACPPPSDGLSIISRTFRRLTGFPFPVSAASGTPPAWPSHPRPGNARGFSEGRDESEGKAAAGGGTPAKRAFDKRASGFSGTPGATRGDVDPSSPRPRGRPALRGRNAAGRRPFGSGSKDRYPRNRGKSSRQSRRPLQTPRVGKTGRPRSASRPPPRAAGAEAPGPSGFLMNFWTSWPTKSTRPPKETWTFPPPENKRGPAAPSAHPPSGSGEPPLPPAEEPHRCSKRARNSPLDSRTPRLLAAPKPGLSPFRMIRTEGENGGVLETPVGRVVVHEDRLQGDVPPGRLDRLQGREAKWRRSLK